MIFEIPLSIGDPDLVRALADHPNFHSGELWPGKPNGHKYGPGEIRTLVGLEDYPEFNGQMVKITSIRLDGPKGKAYYVEGEINKLVNWVYEYRLE